VPTTCRISFIIITVFESLEFEHDGEVVVMDIASCYQAVNEHLLNKPFNNIIATTGGMSHDEHKGEVTPISSTPPSVLPIVPSIRLNGRLPIKCDLHPHHGWTYQMSCTLCESSKNICCYDQPGSRWGSDRWLLTACQSTECGQGMVTMLSICFDRSV
jgi:hypothetical protein